MILDPLSSIFYLLSSTGWGYDRPAQIHLGRPDVGALEHRLPGRGRDPRDLPRCDPVYLLAALARNLRPDRRAAARRLHAHRDALVPGYDRGDHTVRPARGPGD